MNRDDAELLTLPATLDLAAAEDLFATLRRSTASGRPLWVDASEVETLTLPCIQLLLAAGKSHGRVWIENPSQAFVSAFDDLAIDWQGLRAPSLAHSQDESSRSDPAHVEHPAQVSDLGSQQPDEAVMTKRIMTIDDSKTMREMLRITLAEAGFDVLQATDGQEGVDALEQEKVDVVITDINMPRMDGYEVIRQLRRNPIHKTTPILVLTTESDTEKRQLARQAGATGWMVKPFDPDRLVATVRKVSP